MVLEAELLHRGRTHQHARRRVDEQLAHGCGQAIGIEPPPEQNVTVEQEALPTSHRWRASGSRGLDSHVSSSFGAMGSSSRLGSLMGPRMRWGASGRRGISRAQGLPALASTMVSPAWASLIRRYRWVLAWCTFTTRIGPCCMTASGVGLHSLVMD